MRRWTWIVLAAAAPLAADAKSLLLDGVAGVVNRHTLTVGDAINMVEPMQARLRRAYRGEELDRKLSEAYSDALNALVERKLVADAYEKEKNKIPEETVRNRVERILRQRSGGDRMGFARALQREGITLEEWKEETRARLVISFMKGRMAERRGVVSPQAVRQSYERDIAKYTLPAQAQIRMIVVGDAAAQDEAGRKRIAEETLQKLRAGADFADLARSVSTDAKAKEGGDWGWIKLADLRPEIARAAAATPVGAVSDAIPVEGDFYILRVEDRTDGGTLSFDQVQSRIENALAMEEQNRRHDAWIARLRAKSYVALMQKDLMK